MCQGCKCGKIFNRFRVRYYWIEGRFRQIENPLTTHALYSVTRPNSWILIGQPRLERLACTLEDPLRRDDYDQKHPTHKRANSAEIDVSNKRKLVYAQLYHEVWAILADKLPINRLITWGTVTRSMKQLDPKNIVKSQGGEAIRIKIDKEMKKVCDNFGKQLRDHSYKFDCWTLEAMISRQYVATSQKKLWWRVLRINEKLQPSQITIFPNCSFCNCMNFVDL